MENVQVPKDVFHIAEGKEGKKPSWTKIGSAFVNRDGSINAYLDLIPQSGTIHIRNRKTTKENQDEKKV